MAASGKEYRTEQIRNVAVLGHGGSGKTTLVDALCFSAGTSRRKGNVEEGHCPHHDHSGGARPRHLHAGDAGASPSSRAPRSTSWTPRDSWTSPGTPWPLSGWPTAPSSWWAPPPESRWEPKSSGSTARTGGFPGCSSCP